MRTLDYQKINKRAQALILFMMEQQSKAPADEFLEWLGACAAAVQNLVVSGLKFGEDLNEMREVILFAQGHVDVPKETA